jgi:hypothetical protein
MIVFLPLLAVLQATAPPAAAMSTTAVARLDECACGGVPVRVDSRLYPPPTVASPVHAILPDAFPPDSQGGSNRLTRGVIGGLIGAMAGVAVCTLFSNAFFNEGGGFSTCTTKGNLMFAGGGLAVGFAVGWLTGHDP